MAEREAAGAARVRFSDDLKSEALSMLGVGGWSCTARARLHGKLTTHAHEPIHVHVRKGDGEAVFELATGVDLRESLGLKVRELKRAQELAEEHRDANTSGLA